MGAGLLTFGCGPSADDGDGGDDALGSTSAGTTVASTSGAPGGSTGQTTVATSAASTGGGMTTSGGTTGGAVDDTGPSIYFDLGVIPDSPMLCGQGKGDVQYSYIWIANSSQSTISKINTQTMVEEGRYLTRPDSNGNPSRTSVSLNGNVAVANRSGGLTKFYANHDDCPDGNGNGVVNTSNDATWMAWGSDECLAWHTPMAYASQRPVAWTQGEWDQAACKTVNEKVWTSGANGTIDVLLVDGDTGVIEETIPIPGVSPNFYGIYGAAVDSDGNFWGSQLSIGQLVNVDRQTFAVQTWPMSTSGYGMTVDSAGNVWTCSGSGASRFDTTLETWQSSGVTGGGGCMEDANGILWLATNPLKGVNTSTLALEYSIPIPNYVHGVSIDFEGNVWGVTLFGTDAYRVDPVSGTIDTFTGLVSPYTYSDMTGFALNNVGGGGAPSG